MTSTELLLDLSEQVRGMITRTRNEFLNCTDEQLEYRPQAGSWSILQCYEHLNRYCRYYNPAIGERMRSGKQSADHIVKSTWIGRKSIEVMAPSNQKKQKTLRHMDTNSAQPGRSAIAEFIDHQEDLLKLLKDARTTDLNSVRVPVEFFRLLKMNLGDAFQFLIVHQQRHFIQLGKLLQESSASRKVA